jgi:threonylcarbamoyladenosine tRNA methylthiotransferase MtaB
MKVSIVTLGCRVNQAESAIIEGTLKQNGATIVQLSEKPDYCVINSCTVTARSDYNSRQLIRRAAKAGAKVIVTGCYSQLRNEEARRLPGVWKVIENSNKLDVITEIIRRKSPPFFGYYGRSRPHLKVQDGCNFRCSYCSVPFARGKSVSLQEAAVLERARTIESAGYHEVVLTGIHLGSYGYDLNGSSSLKILLRRLLRETSIKRIRLSSLEISEIDDEMIDLISEERICKHLHLPLQSGSERLLRMMRRRYTLESFVSTVGKIAQKIDNISVGTDIIVGFPGEGEEDFSDTLTLVRELPLSYMHIFPFSPRPGTEAESMEGRPDSRTTKKRADMLAELNRVKKREYMSGQFNRTLDVIVEDVNEDGEYCLGTSGNYLKVRAGVSGCAIGSLILVKPTAIRDQVLQAVLI